MAERQITFADLRDGEKVTLRLRDGESVIVGTVSPGLTPGGGRKVNLTNNANSVVLYERTNFRIFADRGPTAAEAIGALPLGSIFEYRNKYDNVVRWVKSGDDRVTRVDDERPAYSLSISGGFLADDVEDRLRVIY